MTSPLPLAGRTAVVTGVSRKQGIGYAVASRLAQMGASLFLAHYAPHDQEQPWGADPIEGVVGGVHAQLTDGARLADSSINLAEAGAAERLIDQATSALGHLDILICNHARSGGDGPLAAMTAEKLDAHWLVNTRSTLLATREFAARHDGRAGGRVIWMTSGQVDGGVMEDEIAYAASKAALAGITPSVSAGLARQGILLNTVNPGPVNTGYLDAATADRSPEILVEVLSRFPGGRFGEPEDPARLIAWLVSDEGRWMVGQVLSSDGGFR